MQNTELEIKYLLNKKMAQEVKNKINKILGVSVANEAYEKTTMLDNPLGIIGKDDARLRLREIGKSKTDNDLQIEFSYKRRIQADGGIKREEEIEVAFKENPRHLYKILEKMGFVPLTSYERYRDTYMINEDHTKITMDRFPFGHILEIEGEEENIKKYCEKLNLNINDSYPLSCDDAYVDLCKNDGIKPNDHILFDDPEMPQIK